MPVLTGVAIVAEWEYFFLVPPPALGLQTADDVIRVYSECSSENTDLMGQLKEISSG